MDTAETSKPELVSLTEDADKAWDDEIQQLVQTLPKKQATLPKSGTTWLKALAFSTLSRNQFARDDNPLVSFIPHQLVSFLEHNLYLNTPWMCSSLFGFSPTRFEKKRQVSL
ncbi:hypothetical protein V6N13_054913 [Hibiscus sabdariffa]|uniref:Sulfotransferase n=1 Tax=Hibiscus sabdariffa TaxID=183260 RepID=A0ABR2DY07_9ROSI